MCSHAIRELLLQFRALPVAGDGDVREPGAGLVAAERVGEGAAVAADVLEGEHGRAAGLAVAVRAQLDGARGLLEPVEDAGQLVRRRRAEEDERDVQMVARNDTDAPAGEDALLPGDDRVEPVAGQAQREEEAQPLTTGDATRQSRAPPSKVSERGVTRSRPSAPGSPRGRRGN